MSKLTFIHEDSDFANMWKTFGTEHMAESMNPFSKMRLGRKTMLSGLEYHDLIMNPGKKMALNTAISSSGAIEFKTVDMSAYDGSGTKWQDIDELTQWVSPKWHYPKIKLHTFINKLIHTDKKFDEDYLKFKEWLKQRLAFKRMDRHDLNRNNFFAASRRYGSIFAGQSFTTY